MKIESLEMFSLCYYTIGNIPFHTLTYRHNGIKPRARDLSKMTFFSSNCHPMSLTTTILVVVVNEWLL